MPPAIIAACAWGVACCLTSFLPMRYQYAPGLTLLIAFPALLVWIGVAHGWLWVGILLAAFVSMFRRPIRYFWRKWRGLPVDAPSDGGRA